MIEWFKSHAEPLAAPGAHEQLHMLAVEGARKLHHDARALSLDSGHSRPFDTCPSELCVLVRATSPPHRSRN